MKTDSSVQNLTNSSMQEIAKVLARQGNVQVYGTAYPRLRRLVQDGIAACVADQRRADRIAEYALSRLNQA